MIKIWIFLLFVVLSVEASEVKSSIFGGDVDTSSATVQEKINRIINSLHELDLKDIYENVKTKIKEKTQNHFFSFMDALKGKNKSFKKRFLRIDCLL